MSQKQEELKEQAEDAINDLFGDTSVPKSVTLESLEELQGLISDLLDNLDE